MPPLLKGIVYLLALSALPILWDRRSPPLVSLGKVALGSRFL